MATMMIAPVVQVDGAEISQAQPIAVRLIGVLDRVLIDRFTDACTGLFAAGRATIVVALRDLVPVQRPSIERLITTLKAYRDAGHYVSVTTNPMWRRMLREADATLLESVGLGLGTRRQIIIAHSVDSQDDAN
jgi:hypothetical protein